MQCEIRGMADISEAGRPPPDTMPKRGRVNEVCREWLVHEDGALAYKLQKEEVEQHYTGNKSRNAVVRLDIPLAKSEQQREREEALAKYQQSILEQERYDAEVARRLAERMELEEEVRRLECEHRDEEMARHLQVGPTGLDLCTRAEREKVKIEKERREKERQDAEHLYLQHHSPRQMPTASRSSARSPSPQQAKPLPPRQPKPGPSSSPIHQTPTNARIYPKPVAGAVALEEAYGPGAAAAGGHFAHTPPRAVRQSHHTHGDINAIGLPPAPSPEDIAQHIRQINLSRHPPNASQCEESLSSVDLFEEEARRLQEEKDAELARQLQEEEEREGPDALDRDRLLAIEAQDQELARMLQDKEKAKLRRARERAKQKALLKKQQEQKSAEMCTGPSGSGASTPLVQSLPDDDDGCYSLPHQDTSGSVSSDYLQHSIRLSDIDTSGATSKFIPSKGKKRFPDPEAIEEIPTPSVSNTNALSGPGLNIAIAIDPTYPRRSPVSTSERGSPSVCPAMPIPSAECTEEECNPAPPYMPIQGHRRTSSLEKKGKRKGGKDGCKQQ